LLIVIQNIKKEDVFNILKSFLVAFIAEGRVNYPETTIALGSGCLLATFFAFHT
jgi:hypothetical protein